MKAVIVDIDGTTMDIRHRLHHVTHGKRNWAAFNAEMDGDTVIKPVADLVRTLSKEHHVLFCCGREEAYREITERQLDEAGIPRDALYMRPTGDTRPDHIVKSQILDGIIQDGYEPFIVVDDRQPVVNMWRERGLICLQAAPQVDQIPETGALTLMVGPTGAGKSSFLRDSANLRRVISSDDIRADMCGDFQDQSKNAQVFEAIHEIAKTRLKHGLSVTIDATHLRRKDRLASALLAPNYIPVRYVVVNRSMEDKRRDGGWRNSVKDKDGNPFDLIAKHEQIFRSNLSDIMRGDGLPNVTVIDLRDSRAVAA